LTYLAPLQYEPQYERGVMLPVTDCAQSTDHRASRAMEAPRWYVLNTYPQAEFEVFTALGQFRRHLPTIVEYRSVLRHGHRGPAVMQSGKPVTKAIIRPFFPGYLFVEMEPSDPSWGAIRHTTRGVKRFLTTADNTRPLPVPVGFVEALMAKGRAGDGAIDPGATPQFPALAPGQAVSVTVNGTDISTVVHMSERDRVWVLLRMFDRDVPTEVDRASVREIAG